MTVYEGQPIGSVDPEASLRAELTGAIAVAQFDIESAIAEVMRSGADVSALANQAQSLQQLQKQIGSAVATTLISLRAEIAGVVATTQAVTQQARSIVATAAQAAAEALGAASANSRATVSAIMRDMHRFDSYLRFASTEDEAEYRKREAERRAYIDAQHAKATPEGNLNAAGAAIGQMADAELHGAGASPEFRQRKTELIASTNALREQMKANGQSTASFDNRLDADMRRILIANGHSEAEAQQFIAASGGDPIVAAQHIERAQPPASAITASKREAPEPTATVGTADDELTSIMATLKAAGVAATSVCAPPRATNNLAKHERAADTQTGRC